MVKVLYRSQSSSFLGMSNSYVVTLQAPLVFFMFGPSRNDLLTCNSIRTQQSHLSQITAVEHLSPIMASITISLPTQTQLQPPDISPEALQGLQDQRKVKLAEFGYKENYGVTTSTAAANKKRDDATAQADDWFFAALGRQCAQGQRLLATRDFFHTCRQDFGWKADYGKLCSREAANSKREAANQKAVKYVAEKFGYPASLVQSWCF